MKSSLFIEVLSPKYSDAPYPPKELFFSRKIVVFSKSVVLKSTARIPNTHGAACKERLNKKRGSPLGADGLAGGGCNQMRPA